MKEELEIYYNLRLSNNIEVELLIRLLEKENENSNLSGNKLIGHFKIMHVYVSTVY